MHSAAMMAEVFMVNDIIVGEDTEGNMVEIERERST